MSLNKRFVAKNGLDNNNKTITNVANPVNAQDVSTRNFSSNADNLLSGTLPTARLPAFTGDLVSTQGSNYLSLNNTGVSVGTYGSASTCGQFVADAKGRITSAANIPIVIAQNAVIDLVNDLALKAPLASPELTGIPTVPTPSLETNSTQIANTSFVQSGLALKADLESPVLTGTPQAPTAPSGTSTNQIATTAFVQDSVDASKQGLIVKDAVRVTTVENITLEDVQIVDGVNLSIDDRVLVKNQTNAEENGIYLVKETAWERAIDFNTPDNIISGSFTFVQEGSTYSDSGWVLTTDEEIIVNTTPLAFARFSGAGQIIAGNGIVKNGNTLAVNVADTNRLVVDIDSIDLAATGITSGTYTSLTVDAYGRATAGSNPTTLSGYGITDAQPLDADLTSIASLATNEGFLKKVAENTWSLDTNTYLTEHPSISAASSPTTNSNLQYIQNLTLDSNGHITAITSEEIQDATTSQKGVVQLYNNTDSDSSELAATANAVKITYDLASGKVSATGNILPVTHGDISSSSLTTTTDDQNQVAMSIDATTYRTVKFLVQITSGNDFHSTELLAIHDDTVVHLTEYGSIWTGAEELSTFSADISGSNLRLLVSPTNPSTTYKIIRQAVNV